MDWQYVRYQWFSYADFDTDGTVARSYRLDETPETLDAFRRGLDNYASSGLIG